MSRYMIFGVVCMTLLIQAMGGSAVAVAFPEIAASFNVSVVIAGWVLSAYPLATVITLPLSGKASDALGRKRTFGFSVALFTMGSFLCAIAPNIYWLILFRLVQGAGFGGFMTSATGIVADTFPEARQRWLGLITSIVGVGTVLGPSLGGWLTQSFGWRSIFWFTIPMGLAALNAGALLLDRDKKMERFVFDIKGAGLFAAALAAFMAGLTTLGGRSSSSSWAMPAGLILAGSALLTGFVRHERRVESPMIDLVVLQGKPFMAANAFNLAFGVMLGVFSFVPLYAVAVLGVSTIQSGAIMTPRAIGMVGGSIGASLLLVRLGYRRPMIAGVLLMAAAGAILGFRFQDISIGGMTVGGVAVMLVAVALSGLGQGISSPAANNACMELMPSRVSTITGVRNTYRHTGQALGIAMASIVLASFGSLSQGFAFVFFGLAVAGLMAIPFIFAMPSSSADGPAELQDKPGCRESS